MPNNTAGEVADTCRRTGKKITSVCPGGSINELSPDDKGTIPNKGKIFIFDSTSTPVLGLTHSSIQWAPRGFFYEFGS